MATKPKFRQPIHPDIAAKAYYKRIKPLLVQLRDDTRRNLQPALDSYRVMRELETNTDSKCDSSPAFFRKAKENFRTQLIKASQESAWSNESVAKAVKPSYKDTQRVVKGNLTRQKVPVPHPDPKHVAQYIQRNVELIQTIPQRSFSTLGRMIDNHIESNATVETLAKAIESRYGVTASQAALIASDQTSKLNSELCNQAYVEAGVKRGVWETSKDERVRESHNAVDGKTFDLTEGLMVDGELTFPGQPIACRCWCVPIL